MSKAHLTAISRNKLSAPARWLNEHGLLEGRVLDYGCGRGDIFKHLLTEGVDGAQFDPHWHPECPSGYFHTVYCGFVLNVLGYASDREALVDNVESMLSDGGTAYFAVRRDIKKEGLTSKGTEQYDVTLELPLVYEKKGAFAIYKLEK